MDKETVVLGGGCFWCTETVFKMLKGVTSVEPGYVGGVEVVKIEFDPDQLAFEEILRVFFVAHDPTSLNKQGADVGPRYASVIFYTTQRQKEKAEHYIGALNKTQGTKPIVTRVEELGEFTPAEDYHKDFYESGQRPDYCELVIDPKIEKVRHKFKDLLQ